MIRVKMIKNTPSSFYDFDLNHFDFIVFNAYTHNSAIDFFLTGFT